MLGRAPFVEVGAFRSLLRHSVRKGAVHDARHQAQRTNLSRQASGSTQRIYHRDATVERIHPTAAGKSTTLRVGSAAALLAAFTYYGLSDAFADAGPSDVAIKGPDASLSSSKERMISMDEVAEHTTVENGLWVVIEGQVYDLTSFVDRHPGGAQVIRKHAGKDATDVYVPVHPSDAIRENLSPEQHVGQVDPATVKHVEPDALSERERQRRYALDHLPPLDLILNLDDFERVARAILTDQAWAYYSSAADDEITKHHNRSAYARIWFKPRILRRVAHVDPSTTLLAHDVALPVYISPSAMAKLGHPLGEINLTRAAGQAGIIQGISANASCSLDEMIEARLPDQSAPQVYQLYVNKDRSASEKILRKIQETPKGTFAAVMLTVDAAVMGNREVDVRSKGATEPVKTGGETASQSGGGGGGGGGGGVGQAISGYLEPDLDWDLIKWYKKNCSLPLIIKGIQSVEDVALAAKNGCQGVVLSNHGGRSLEYAPAPIDVLIALREERPDLFNKIDIFIDGGVRRGTDVLKALALGAKAVGLGRPFLYAQSGYGEAGAARAIQILREEIERDMRLLGVRSLKELTPDMIDVLPRFFDPYLLHRQAERKEEYPF